MKKTWNVLTGLVLVASLLSACGASGNAKATTAGAKESSAVESAESKADAGKSDAAKKGLKIAIVSSPSGVDDGSFNQDIVADYDVLVCCGFQFAGIGSIAKDNPNTKFILVDSYPTDADGNEVTLDNVYAMQFKEQESGFFAGIAAALETKSGKVAVVNGIAYPSNVNYQYGFMSGVNYAKAKYNAKAEYVEIPSYAGTDVTNKNVGGNYVGNFSDEATGKVVGKALLDKGVDIMLVAAGGSGNGVFTAVKEAGNAEVIGCDVDQYDDGKNGDKNIILTSVLKVMHSNVEKQLEKVLDGSFKGENALLGADTDSTGYVKEEGRQQLSKETLEKLSDVYEKVKSGEIVPAANFNNMTPDNFTGLK